MKYNCGTIVRFELYVMNRGKHWIFEEFFNFLNKEKSDDEDLKRAATVSFENV